MSEILTSLSVGDIMRRYLCCVPFLQILILSLLPDFIHYLGLYLNFLDFLICLAKMSYQENSTLPPTPPSEETINAVKMAVNASTKHKHIWVITGPAGCGKTSVAEYLHETFSIPYLEGDTVSVKRP